MKKLYSICLILLLSVTSVYCSTVQEGTEALKNKDYAKAISIYNSILEQGRSSGEMHYNMGIAYAELQEVGRAIWHFHLAETKGFTSRDLAHNLQLVKERRIDEIEVVPEFFLLKWWNTWKSFFGSNAWSMIAILLLISGVYGLYTWQSGANRQRRKLGFMVGLPLVFLAGIAFLSAWGSASDLQHPHRGILLANTYDLRSAPDLTSAGILAVHAGLSVDVQDQIGDWIKVRLENGQIGWLPIEEVGLY